MAKRKYEESNIQAFAEAIREKTGSEQTYKVSDMASGVNEVYEAGKQKEWNDFWDSFQNYGNRTNYAYAFYNNEYSGWFQWNKDTIKPKYDLIPTNANRMFYSVKNIVDLGEHLKEFGVKLDLSKATNMALFCPHGDFVKLPVLDCSNATTIDNAFNYCYELETIEKLVLTEKITSISGPFVGCSKFKNIIIEGVIAPSISFSYSPLTVASLKSIITHLKDYSGTDKEFTYTVTFSSACIETLEAEGATSPNGNLWTDYILDLGWNYN